MVLVKVKKTELRLKLEKSHAWTNLDYTILDYKAVNNQGN